MSLRPVTWTSRTLLPCHGEEDASVILCIAVDNAALRDCPGLSTDDFVFNFIEATLQDFCVQKSKIRTLYQYTFLYDDEQLIAGQTVGSAEILGAFCDGCLSDWIESIAGEGVYLDTTEEGDIIFVSRYKCEYIIPLPPGAFVGDIMFGAGTDGDLVVSNGESLILPFSRDHFFRNVTIEEGGELRLIASAATNDSHQNAITAYFKMHVSGTLIVNGHLTADGRHGQVGIPRGYDFNANPVCACNAAGELSDLAGGAGGLAYSLILNSATNSGVNYGPYGSGGGDYSGGCGGVGGYYTFHAGSCTIPVSSALPGGAGGSPGFGCPQRNPSSGSNFTSGQNYIGGGYGGVGGDGGTVPDVSCVGTKGGSGGGNIYLGGIPSPGGCYVLPAYKPVPVFKARNYFPRITTLHRRGMPTNRFSGALASEPYHTLGGLQEHILGMGLAGGMGGGGGGGGQAGLCLGNGQPAGGSGGGGGGGAGTIFVAAKNLEIGSSGRISANGGNGGNGGPGGSDGGELRNAGGGGAGGGGGGGLIHLTYRNVVNNGIIEAIGGSGGIGGVNILSGTPGAPGSDGADGEVVLVNLGARTLQVI